MRQLPTKIMPDLPDFEQLRFFLRCRKWHPDRNKDNKEKAEKKFRDVSCHALVSTRHCGMLNVYEKSIALQSPAA